MNVKIRERKNRLLRMENFDFVSPTKIYFGEGKENLIGSIINSYGYKKILFCYGQGSIKRNGLYKKVVSSLKKAKIEFYELDGIEPNPDVSLVRKGIDICREKELDFILTVGGGSVIDTGKLISCGYYYNGDPYDISLKKVVCEKALPLGVILTNSASGSELSNSCVISSRELKMKQGYNTDLNRPLFVIENPKLTFSVDLHTTGCGVVDILSHTFERYFSSSNKNEFSDYIALGLMKSLVDNARRLAKNLKDYQARANIMIASSYSHNGLTSLGKRNNMPIHKLEHELSALYPNISHGEGLAILIPSWIEVCCQYNIEKFVTFSKIVLDVDQYLDDNKIIEEGIKCLKELFSLFNLKTSLSEFNVSKEDISIMNSHIVENKIKMFDIDEDIDYNLAMKIYLNCLF